jgi:hypothetical protein
MKIAGFFLLLAGWLLSLAPAILLHPGAAEGAFVLVAVAVEVLGLTLLFRAHLPPRRRRS